MNIAADALAADLAAADLAAADSAAPAAPPPAEHPTGPPLGLSPGRPLIALFTAARPQLDAIVPLRLRAVVAETLLQGAEFGLLATADIDMANRTARYLTPWGTGWRHCRGALPAVVMNPIHPATDADVAALAFLRGVAPVTTTRLANKIGIGARLAKTAVAPHVIPFRPVPVDQIAPTVSRFLAKHKRAVLKPAAGRRGRGVLFLAQTPEGVTLREGAVERRMTIEALAEELAPRFADSTWLIQRFVVSNARDGRAFDVRVHCHKDGDGTWALVRAYVRLSEAGLLVSNTSRGGYQGDVDAFFANAARGPDGRTLGDQVRQVGLDTAIALDREAGGLVDELGVDLLVDPQRHPWIIEVNTHPQSRYHELERARFAVAYALHLARRRAD